MRSKYKRIGDYIELVDERNVDLEIDMLLGLSVSKQFIPSVANIVGADMKNYKIIRKGQFACSTMQVRRDGKMPVALLQDYDKAIISQAYPVFRVIDESELLPEYLMMWFSRSEFDRQATFHAVGGVRGSLEWEDFLDFELPIPSLEKQHEIVKEYNTIVNRIALNEQLNKKLEETAQALYKHWFVDFEFPYSPPTEGCPQDGVGIGKPYKSSGGKMVWCEELDQEIPEGWGVGTIDRLLRYTKNRIGVSQLSPKNYVSTDNMIPDRGGINTASGLPSATTVTKFNQGNILISNIRPYFKKIWIAEYDGGCSNDVLCFETLEDIEPLFAYYILETDEFFDYVMQGAKGTKMPRGDKDWIMNYIAILPDKETMRLFKEKVHSLFTVSNERLQENTTLLLLSQLLLSKMTKVEVEKEKQYSHEI